MLKRFSSQLIAGSRPVSSTVLKSRVASAASVRSSPVFYSPRRFYSEEKKQPEEQEQEATSTENPAETEEANDELSQLQQKYEAKDKELALLKEKFQRKVADFENLQKSTEKTVKSAKDFALQSFAKDLLESLDNFDRALTAVPEEKRDDSENHKELVDLYTGIKMTQDVFEKTLAKYGLVKVEPLDEKFDPNVHEATFQVPQPDKEPGTVFHVQQPGYSLNNRVIRAPKVGVVKGDD